MVRASGEARDWGWWSRSDFMVVLLVRADLVAPLGVAAQVIMRSVAVVRFGPVLCQI